MTLGKILSIYFADSKRPIYYISTLRGAGRSKGINKHICNMSERARRLILNVTKVSVIIRIDLHTALDAFASSAYIDMIIHIYSRICRPEYVSKALLLSYRRELRWLSYIMKSRDNSVQRATDA